MYLEILSPEKNYFTGDVFGIQLPGNEGLFEILDNHAPIVASLKKGQIKIISIEKKEDFISIEKGFIEVSANKATILIESLNS